MMTPAKTNEERGYKEQQLTDNKHTRAEVREEWRARREERRARREE
jgi:hypothetical protein